MYYSQDKLDERLRILLNLLDSSFGKHFKLLLKNPKQAITVGSNHRRLVYQSVDDKPWLGKFNSFN